MNKKRSEDICTLIIDLLLKTELQVVTSIYTLLSLLHLHHKVDIITITLILNN